MRLVSPKCTSCGASLGPREEAGTYTCEYCGTTFTAEPAEPAEPARALAEALRAQAARSAEEAQALREALRARALADNEAVPASRSGCAVAVVVILLVLAAGGALAWFLYNRSAPERATQAAFGLESNEWVLWDDYGGAPVPATVKGQPAVLGRIRVMPDKDELWIVAIDAATALPFWKVGPFGTYLEGYQHTRFAVSGRFVAVSDFHSILHVYDLDTGGERRKLTLSDRVQYICPMPESNGVWLEVADNRHLTVALASGMTRESERPEHCAGSLYYSRENARSSGKELAPTVEGFEAVRTRIDGDVAVAAGVKKPGTPIPRVVGFDPATKAVRWSSPVPSVDPNTVRPGSSEYDALAAGRYVTVYGAGADAWHLTAFDARDGTRLWDRTLRPLFSVDSIHDVVATKTHVFVVRTSSLHIFEAATGKLVGPVGKELYDDEEE